ncbi:hypothetical protein TRVL_06166 [Trypanosoma vivax]|nr:hypothetical protein TRVL_06166 [Trypanosoma vivax]
MEWLETRSWQRQRQRGVDEQKHPEERVAEARARELKVTVFCVSKSERRHGHEERWKTRLRGGISTVDAELSEDCWPSRKTAETGEGKTVSVYLEVEEKRRGASAKAGTAAKTGAVEGQEIRGKTGNSTPNAVQEEQKVRFAHAAEGEETDT